MQVQQIGFDPKTDQYFVLPVDSSQLSPLKDLIQGLCPRTAISPYLRQTPEGTAVSFGVLPADANDTMGRLLQYLRPSLPATALLVKLEYTREVCGKHFILTITFDMAPCLALHGNEDEMHRQLGKLLEQAHFPQRLPNEGDPTLEDFASIREACAQLGMYAPGVRIEAKTLKTLCVLCPPV